MARSRQPGHDPADRSCRAQVGIGTLIVFVAMVLVAAIAAGVLVETSGFLQQRSESTGAQSSQQVIDRVAVVSTVGLAPKSYVQEVRLDLKRAPGAGDIDVSEATVAWLGPKGRADVTSGDAAWSLSAISGTTPVLSNDSDGLELTIKVHEKPIDSNDLTADTSATVVITTESGGRTTVSLHVPESVEDESAVPL